MRVLLLNPPGDVIRTGRLVRKSKISTQSWPPILLAYATGVLEKLGNECKLYDASIERDSYLVAENITKAWSPEVIAYYWSYDTRFEDLKFANKLAKDYRVILVGPWSAHYPDALKDCPNVESMTFGPFEYTLPLLIDKQNAKGVKYQDGTFISQGEPYTRADLDFMPFVSHIYKTHLDIKRYHQTSFRWPFEDIFTGTPGSCPYRCGFCSWTNGYCALHPKRWATRSLNNVMEELWYIKNYQPTIKQIFFQDSTLPTPWAKEISQRILDEKLKICWGAYSRADKDYKSLKLMKEAGCRTLHVGYEVPIQSILDEIKKDITVEQEAQFIKDVNKLKMWTSSSFMIFPWMTKSQIEYMVKWIKDAGATRINVAQLQAYPNTPIIDTIAAHRDIPGTHIMGFDEMLHWEQYCFREFYLKNPKFWWNVITTPSELKHTIKDGLGMLKFLGE